MFPVFAAYSAESTVLMFNTGPVHGEAVGSYEGSAVHAIWTRRNTRRCSTWRVSTSRLMCEDPEAGGRTVWLDRSRLDWPFLSDVPASRFMEEVRLCLEPKPRTQYAGLERCHTCDGR